jgi:hypothetical protein
MGHVGRSRSYPLESNPTDHPLPFSFPPTSLIPVPSFSNPLIPDRAVQQQLYFLPRSWITTAVRCSIIAITKKITVRSSANQQDCIQTARPVTDVPADYGDQHQVTYRRPRARLPGTGIVPAPSFLSDASLTRPRAAARVSSSPGGSVAAPRTSLTVLVQSSPPFPCPPALAGGLSLYPVPRRRASLPTASRVQNILRPVGAQHSTQVSSV